MALGGNFMFWLPKQDGASKRDKAWGSLPYVKGMYPVNDTFSPYVRFEFGVSQWIPSEGNNIFNIPIGGGVGCDFNFGSFGAFLGFDFLYHIGLTDLKLRDEERDEEISAKQRWSSLAINLGLQYNF